MDEGVNTSACRLKAALSQPAHPSLFGVFVKKLELILGDRGWVSFGKCFCWSSFVTRSGLQNMMGAEDVTCDTSCGIVLAPLSSIPRNSIRIYTHVVMNVIVVIYSIIAIPISFWKSTIVLAGRPLLAAAAACKVQHKARRSRWNELELLSVINVPPRWAKIALISS